MPLRESLTGCLLYLPIDVPTVHTEVHNRGLSHVNHAMAASAITFVPRIFAVVSPPGNLQLHEQSAHGTYADLI